MSGTEGIRALQLYSFMVNVSKAYSYLINWSKGEQSEEIIFREQFKLFTSPELDSFTAEFRLLLLVTVLKVACFIVGVSLLPVGVEILRSPVGLGFFWPDCHVLKDLLL